MAVLDSINALLAHGIAFFNLAPSKFHHSPDEFRNKFILNDGTQQLVKKLGNFREGVRMAALDCIKRLSVYGIILFDRASSDFHHFLDDFQISVNSVRELIGKLDILHPGVRKTALGCVKALSVHGTVYFNLTCPYSHHFPDNFQEMFISSIGVKKLMEVLDDLDEDVQKTALDCIETLSRFGMIFFNLAFPNSKCFTENFKTEFEQLNANYGPSSIT